MPDDYDSISTLVAPNPYDAISTRVDAKPADPYDTISRRADVRAAVDPYDSISAKVLQSSFDPKTYDPRVKPGEYPVTGLVDAFSQSVAEPVAKAVVEPLSTALDTFRRPVASMIAGKGDLGDRASLAWQSRPALFGGKPELAPSPEDTKHALGIGEIDDKPGFNPDGSIAWGNVATSKLPNEAANLAFAMLTDPVTYLTPGASRAAQAAKVAKIEALGLRAAGDEAAAVARMVKAKLPMPPAFAGTEAAQWVNPSLSELAKTGDFGVKLHPPHLPIPFLPRIPGETFIAAPKWVAPLLKPFEFLQRDVLPNSRVARALKNPDPREPFEMIDRAASNENLQKVNDMVLQEVIEGNKIAAPDLPDGLDAAKIELISPLHEQMKAAGARVGEGYGFRPASDAEASIAKSIGLDVQDGIPFGDRIGEVVNENKSNFPTLRKDIEAAFKEGPQKQWKGKEGAGQNQAILEEMSGWTPGQRARAVAWLKHWEDAPTRILKFQRDNGLPVQAMNTDALQRPTALLDVLDAIRKREPIAAVQDMWGNGSGKATPHTWDTQVGHEVDRSFKTAEANPDAYTQPEGTAARIQGEQLQSRLKAALNKPIYTMADVMREFPDVNPRELDTAMRNLEISGDVSFNDGYFRVKFPRTQPESIFSKWPFNREAPPPAFNRGEAAYTASPTRTSPRLSALVAKAMKGKLDGAQLASLVEELNKDSLTNYLPSKELAALKNTLIAELPQALKEFNAVPNYRPANFSTATRNVAPRPNPNLSKVGLEDGIGERRLSIHGPGGGDPSIPGVTQNVALMNAERARGSATTEGRPVAGQSESFIDMYLKPEGYKRIVKDIRETAPDAKTFEPRLDVAFERQLRGSVYNALRAKDIDAMTLRVWQGQPLEAVEAVKKMARQGFPEPPRADNIATNKPYSLADLQKTFADNGGVGNIENLLNPKAAADLAAGRLAPSEAFNQTWNPYNRALHKFADGSEQYIHGEIARQADTIKKLGTDPYHFSRWLGQAAPALIWMTNAWKKNATFRGPQFFSYQLRNQIGDMSRMAMSEGLDFSTARDMKRLMGTSSKGTSSLDGGRLAEYATTGDRRVFSGMMVDWGERGMVDGATAALEWERQGILNHGEITGDVLGNEVARTTGPDNSWKAMAKRNIPGAKKVLDVLENVGDKMIAWSAARENANRVAMFNTRVRMGDSFAEAAYRVDEALFDFRRNSPAAHFMRQTGIVPFAAWHSKVYPFILKWAVENPGEFTATLRALDAVNQHEIADSQLPEWMRGKHNMILRKFRGPRGEMEIGVVTNSGILPIEDMREMASGIAQMGEGNIGRGLDVFFEKTGPILKVFYEGMKIASEEEGKHTAAESATTLAVAAIGRPAASWQQLKHINIEDPRTGETPSVLDTVAGFVGPARMNSVNLTTSGAISISGAAKDHRSAVINAGRAQTDLAEATARFNAAQGEYATVSTMVKDPRQLQSYVDRVTAAQNKAARMAGIFKQRQADLLRTRKAFESVSRAP